MTDNIEAIPKKGVLLELDGKEAHFIKIIRSLAFGEFTITKRNNKYITVRINQSIKLEDDPEKHITVRDRGNFGFEEDDSVEP